MDRYWWYVILPRNSVSERKSLHFTASWAFLFTSLLQVSLNRLLKKGKSIMITKHWTRNFGNCLNLILMPRSLARSSILSCCPHCEQIEPNEMNQNAEGWHCFAGPGREGAEWGEHEPGIYRAVYQAAGKWLKWLWSSETFLLPFHKKEETHLP